MSNIVDLKNNKCVISWDLSANEAGDFISSSKWKLLSVSVDGIFSGARIAIEGANLPDTENMFILNDPNGNPLVFESKRLEAILEDVVRIRPRVIGGDSMTKLNVNLLMASWR